MRLQDAINETHKRIPDTLEQFSELGVMDKIQADTALKAIYYKYLQGLKAMNQKTALFVVKNTLKRTVTNQENNSTNA
ncbi:hypothetical protein [Psychrobacter pasteurii]